MSRPCEFGTQPPIRDLLQPFGATNNSDRRMALIKQMLYGEAAALDILNRHRAEVRFIPSSIQQNDRNSAQLELPDALVDAPDRREQHSANPLLQKYQQLSA